MLFFVRQLCRQRDALFRPTTQDPTLEPWEYAKFAVQQD